MIKIHHANFGAMRAIPGDPNPTTLCHCLILEENGKYALIDTGLGVDEMAHPDETLGKALMDGWGFEINPHNTALYQLGQWGIAPETIGHIVMTHLDVDHAGGLPDFPHAVVHLSAEEKANLDSKNPRYLYNQFDHQPKWKTYAGNDGNWFGLPSRKLELGFEADVRLIPLFGHTRGHCGVAIQIAEDKWLLHAGDVYYRRRELTENPNPLEALVTHSCDDNALRLQSLDALRRLMRDHAASVSFFSTHDLLEYPPAAGKRILFVTTSNSEFAGENARATGVWLEEFAVPYNVLAESGAAITVASPKGGVMPIDPRSNPTPEQAKEWTAAIAASRETVPLAQVKAEDFDAIFLPGGHGPMFDLPNNAELAALLQQFDAQGKVIGAVCHGPAGFVGAVRADGSPLVQGKTLTSYTWAEEVAGHMDTEVPFNLEQRLRDLGANFVDAPPRADHVERDGKFVTGQNPWSSASVGRAFVEILLA